MGTHWQIGSRPARGLEEASVDFPLLADYVAAAEVGHQRPLSIGSPGELGSKR